MSKTDPYYEAIEKFMDGSMSEQERSGFEKSLQEDSVLAKKYQAYQLADQLVFENRLLAVKEGVQAAHQKSIKQNKSLKLGLLGAALLVGAGAAWYGLSNDKVEDKKLPEIEQKAIKVVEQEAVVAPSEPTQSVPKAAKQEASSTLLEKPTQTQVTTSSAIEEKSHEALAPLNVVEHKPNVVDNHSTTEKVEKADPCANVHLTAETHATAACAGQKNGSVYLSGFKGGKSPYAYTLYTLKGVEVSALELEAGSYKASIKDEQGCTTEIPSIEVKSKKCQVAYHFNPFVGESWQIPVHSKTGELTVLDKTGNVYFSVSVPSGTEVHWDGQSSAGELKTGHFLFHIQYTDGTLEQGTISIVR